MAIVNETYDDLLSLTAALCGKPTFTGGEQSMIDAFLNQAARRAYRASDFWERFMVVSQPRSVTRGYVETSEDSYEVYGAGTSDVNGLYTRMSPDSGSYASYERIEENSNGSLVPKYDIRSDGSTWTITARQYITSEGEIVTIDGAWLYEPGDVMYSITSSATTPPTGAWTTSTTGTAPAPALEDVPDIDTFLAIYRYDNVDDRNSIPMTFHVGARGANMHTRNDQTVVYVTFKKKNTSVYGDGTDGTSTTAIPAEWFNYMAYFAARNWQVANRQSNPNQAYAVIAQSEVVAALEDSLMELEAQQTIDTIGKRLYTNITHDRTLV